MIDNVFKLAKERFRKYPAQTITDADYVDGIPLLANIRAQTETPRHSLERATGGRDLHDNADNSEYVCFNQSGDVITLKNAPLKHVDKFTYQGISAEEDIDKSSKSIDSY